MSTNNYPDNSRVERDEQNLVLAKDVKTSEQVLSSFYSKYPYPWNATQFPYLVNPDFEALMLNQDLGDWSHRRIPPNCRIWVAGCGTNQAIMTALRFPRAKVLGSDLSATSLDICRRNADRIGVTNLSLKQESLNNVTYDKEFDYIISTGVIHHNKNPQDVLARLQRGLKVNGVLELMVYNRYHRILTSVFQKVVRIFDRGIGQDAGLDFEADLALAKTLIGNLREEHFLGAYLKSQWDCESNVDDNQIADTLINPIEHSYTVESLDEMADAIGLEMVIYCNSVHDCAYGTGEWNMRFKDEQLQQRYDGLLDKQRWQVTNLLLFETSPLLWFYFQRKDSRISRKDEQQLNESFLAARFMRARTMRKNHILLTTGTASLPDPATVYPRQPPPDAVSEIYLGLDETRPLRETFERLDIPRTFQNITRARNLLTTSGSPYLQAVS